jgi:SAM-dependent methyltransferase
MTQRLPDVQASYWDDRYRIGVREGEWAVSRAKAEFVNFMIQNYGIGTMVDYGCGNGDMLAHIRGEWLPDEHVTYVGTDISLEAIKQVRSRFPDLYFIHRPKLRQQTHAELSLSLDVVQHQVTEAALIGHLDDLFDRASKLVIVYGTNTESGQSAVNVRHWWWTPIIPIRYPEWKMVAGGQGRDYGTVRDFYAWELR